MGAVWGVTMMRDEEDVAEHVLLHMVDEGIQGLVIADNMSIDGTRDCIDRAAAYAADRGVQVVVVDDDEPGYFQSRKMTNLAMLANTHGAEWIIPFDADEIWYAPDRVGVVLREVPDHKNLVAVPLLNHFQTILDDVHDPVPFRRMGWRQTASAPLHKVAFRWEQGAVIGQGNHSVELPSGHRVAYDTGMGLRHFPYRGFEQFKRKAINGAAAYAATDLPIDMGAHWRGYGALLEQQGEDALRAVHDRWYFFPVPSEANMMYDPAPFRRW